MLSTKRGRACALLLMYLIVSIKIQLGLLAFDPFSCVINI